MLTGGSSPLNTAYFRPALGGDMAAVRGMVKWLLQWDREALESGGEPVFDHAFIAEHTDGMDDYLAEVDATSWERIETQSGLSRGVIEHAARIHRDSKRVIICWAMGITQHKHSVPTIQEIANLQLLRGQFGEGAGLCPVRGHSNVQGDRTVGIADEPPAALLDALEKRFGFQPPREPGYNVITTLRAMVARKLKVFLALGGNFAQATPDTPRTHEALRSCDLTVQISTKLNRSHLVCGTEALILPCLGRTDIDRQAAGPQGVTVEDSFSMVHISHGQLKPLSEQMRSEPAIIAGIAEATLGKAPVDWSDLVADYDRIRDLIQDTIPGFENFNERLKHPGGFYLGNPARDRQWHTASGRARLARNPLPGSLVDDAILARGEEPDLVLQTLRSHDQYNTTVYGLHDRYRGVHGERKVVFANRADIQRLGFRPGDKIDLVSLWRDGVERRVSDFTLLEYDVPAGQAAAYYPETNPLVPMDSYGDGSFTPTSKLIAIRLEKNSAPARIA
ncbi:putative oxidoreductase [Alcanivorax sp. ALC70]|nr:putative oxidoreductase [Alcanivorax sp. ALC70]